MENTIKQPTILSLVTYNNKFTWETDHSDINIDDLLEAFYGLCVGVTFAPEAVLQGMKDFAEERLDSFREDE